MYTSSATARYVYVHWVLCREYQYEVTGNWYEPVTRKGMHEDGKVTILWDSNFQTDTINRMMIH